PRVVVLDEPNANLDMAGDNALMATIQQLQRDGCTVVVVTHRTNVLQVVQKIGMIIGGKVARYGPRDEILAAMAKQSQPPGPAKPTRLSSRGPGMPEPQEVA
ncbi:MAG: type I secretion system permease/ATPase, partial [Nitrospira sp.]|nr:type I secretion system permease/ATPase [Nitrospira sp.]